MSRMNDFNLQSRMQYSLYNNASKRDEKTPDIAVKRDESVNDIRNAAKIKQIISDYTNRNISIEEALRRLAEPPICIVPTCENSDGENIYSFEFNGKHFEIHVITGRNDENTEPENIEGDDTQETPEAPGTPEEPETPEVPETPETPADGIEGDEEPETPDVPEDDSVNEEEVAETNPEPEEPEDADDDENIEDDENPAIDDEGEDTADGEDGFNPSLTQGVNDNPFVLREEVDNDNDTSLKTDPLTDIGDDIAPRDDGNTIGSGKGEEGYNYDKKYLTETLKFTEKDLTLYFTEQDGQYTLKQDYIKQILPDKDIKSVKDLLNALKDAKYNEGIIRGMYSFNAEEAKEYFTVTSDGKYVLNQENIKQHFPDSEIFTLGQLKEAITNGVTQSHTDEPAITGISYSDLQGKYGLSDIEIAMFFSQNETGGYDINQEFLVDFFDSKTEFTPEKLINYINGVPMNAKRREMTAEFLADAVRNEDPRFGFDKLNPKPTEKEIETFYKQIVSGFEVENSRFNIINNQLPIYTNLMQLNRLEDMILHGDELNINVSGEEAKQYVTRYAELKKFELDLNSYHSYYYINGTHYREELEYPEGYLDLMIDFAVSDLNIHDEDSLFYAINNDTGTYNVKDILNELRNNINDLMKPAHFTHMGLYKDCTNYNNSASWILYDIKEWQHSDDINERFFSKIFTDFFNETGLDEDEQIAYLRLFGKNLVGRYDGLEGFEDQSGEINIQRIFEYMNNPAEIYEILQKDKNNVEHIDADVVDAATTVGINNLFTNISHQKINAEYIESHLNEMMLSSDPGVRKFAKMINELYSKYFGDYTYTDNDGNEQTGYVRASAGSKTEKQERIKWLITLLNKECGIETPDLTNPKLTPEVFNKLGDDVFNKMETIINSKTLENCILANVNGVIEDFEQGSNVGNCWLLSGIIAINSTPEGKELLRNSIKWNSDFTAITVTFPGTGDSVEITVEELINADPDLFGDYYNNGDNDVLAIVMAWEKMHKIKPTTYRRLDGGMSSLIAFDWANSDDFLKVFLPNADNNRETAGGIDDLGALITGDKCDMPPDDIKEYLLKIRRLMEAGYNVAATFALFTSGTETYSWTTVDKKRETIEISGGHVFAITNIGYDTVTFVNPHDSSVEYTISWTEFAYFLHVAQMSWSVW